jgi:transposase InsO family protein
MDINVFHGILAHADFSKFKLMANSMGINLSGSKLQCRTCAFAKAKAKAVPKTTASNSNKPEGSLFLDISGPYLEPIGGSKYWLRVVDDYTRYAWDSFLTKKSDLQKLFETLLTKIKGLGAGITMEMTAPCTPQMNGVVERSFITVRNRAFAMMISARLISSFQNRLSAEAVHTATRIGNTLT